MTRSDAGNHGPRSGDRRRPSAIPWAGACPRQGPPSLGAAQGEGPPKRRAGPHDRAHPERRRAAPAGPRQPPRQRGGAGPQARGGWRGAEGTAGAGALRGPRGYRTQQNRLVLLSCALELNKTAVLLTSEAPIRAGAHGSEGDPDRAGVCGTASWGRLTARGTYRIARPPDGSPA